MDEEEEEEEKEGDHHLLCGVHGARLGTVWMSTRETRVWVACTTYSERRKMSLLLMLSIHFTLFRVPVEMMSVHHKYVYYTMISLALSLTVCAVALPLRIHINVLLLFLLLYYLLMCSINVDGW